MKYSRVTASYDESDATSGSRTQRPIPAPGIGRRIGEVADLLGARAKAFEAMGVSSGSLQRYIREENAAPFEALARLCIAAGARMEWLATGEGAMLESGSASQSQSQATRPDPDTIAEAAKLLSWAFELQGGVYDPRKDPDLLSDTYMFLIEHGGSLTPDNLVDFSKRLAAKRAQEAGRAKQQGSGGTTPGGGDPR